MNPGEGMNRRDFLRMAGASTAVASTSGTAAAQGGGGNGSSGNNSGGNGGGGSTATGPIDFGGWLEDLDYWSGQASDMTGQTNVAITVGGSANSSLSFGPVAVHVDPGTKITWEWSGDGGAHNVVAEDDSFKSGSPVAESGTTFTQTFNQGGINNYYCQPHQSQGMKGSVAVGNVPRKAPATPVTPAVSQESKTLGVSTFIAMLSSLGLAYFFLKYGGDYEQ